MSFLSRFSLVDPEISKARSGYPLSLQQWADNFTYQSHQYPLFGYGPSYPDERLEQYAQNMQGFAGGAYMGNVVVFACVLARLQVFSQARFQFRQLRNGRPGDFFGDTSLLPLESPEPGKTTSDLLARMETDISLAGNWYGIRSGPNIKRLRPDWVAIALSGEEDDPEAEVLGYVYWPGGPQSGKQPISYLRDEVAHYAPVPDPLARYRGMSWLTPAIREVMADSGFRDHKIKYLEKGGTHNHLFKVEPQSMTKDDFDAFTSAYRSQYEGGMGSYGSIFLRAAVDATPLGTNFQQSDYKALTGAGETRIAAAAGVPPIVVGLSEGLEAATYSNYSQARRRFVDGTMRWLWQNAAASLQTIVPPPPGSQLWYDDRDIPALQEDITERATVQESQSRSMKALVEAGFDTSSVIDAVTSGDMKRLVHTGLVSVQLQPPGTMADKPMNGQGNPAGMVVPNG